MPSKKIGKKGNPGSKRTKIIKNRNLSKSKNLRTKKKGGAGQRIRFFTKKRSNLELKKGLKQIYDMIENLNRSLEKNIESYEKPSNNLRKKNTTGTNETASLNLIADTMSPEETYETVDRGNSTTDNTPTNSPEETYEPVNRGNSTTDNTQTNSPEETYEPVNRGNSTTDNTQTNSPEETYEPVNRGNSQINPELKTVERDGQVLQYVPVTEDQPSSQVLYEAVSEGATSTEFTLDKPETQKVPTETQKVPTETVTPNRTVEVVEREGGEEGEEGEEGYPVTEVNRADGGDGGSGYGYISTDAS